MTLPSSSATNKTVRATFSTQLILTFVSLFSLLFLAGCEQVNTAYQKTAQEADNLKTQAIDTKNKIDEKVTQAQQAADAVKKLTE